VTLWIDKQRPPERLIGPYLVRVLDSLGYKARLKHVKYFFPPTPTTASNQFLYGALGDPRLKTQIGGTIGWNPDWPSASNFFSTELTCASYKHPIGDDNNPAEFCNPSIDREIAQAQALQPTDPQAASALWTTIDHQIVNQAPLLFTWNSDAIDLVSRRVGNYTYNPWTGVLLDQLWVR